MPTFLLSLLGLPRWVKIAAGVVALGLAALLLHKCAVQDAVEADRAESRAAAVETAREADEQAETVANRKSEEVEDANDRAREAAAGSDDPLADALRSLRPPAD